MCPPETAPLDEGGIYKASRLQKVVWNWWEEFWEEWLPKQLRGEPFYLVHNGDVIEGDHHKATTPITTNIEDQKKIAVQVLAPKVARAHKFYSVRGTAAHVGQSSIDENAVAKSLGAVKSKDGHYSRFELWLKLGNHLIHFLHHVGTTSSSAHESSAVNAELAAEFVEAARWRQQPPSVIVRSHRHRAIKIAVPTAIGEATAVVTPAWQLKTPFTFKIPGARLAPPQIGGLLIRLDDADNIYTNSSFTKHIERDEPEE